MQESSEAANGGDRAGDDPLLRAAQLPLLTVPLRWYHDLEAFECPRSPEMQSFARTEARDYVARGLGQVFVLQSNLKRSIVDGFYSFSRSALHADSTALDVAPWPVVISVATVGYLGRDHRTPDGIGAALIIDAAKRGCRLNDNSVGLALYAANPGLVDFFTKMGFSPARRQSAPPSSHGSSPDDRGRYYMVATYEQLIVPIDCLKILPRLKKKSRLSLLVRWLADLIYR